MIKNVLVLLANGSEEIESVVVIDILRRAKLNVTIAGESDIIKCSRDTRIIPDIAIHKINENKLYDLVYLPGGTQGVENMIEIEKVGIILKNHYYNKKLIAAICAAPTILDYFGILPENCKITSHPSVKNVFAKYNYIEDKIAEFGNILSSRGAGTSFDFAFFLVQKLCGIDETEKIKKSIVY